MTCILGPETGREAEREASYSASPLYTERSHETQGNIDKEINEEKETVKIIKSRDNEVTVEHKTSSIVA